MLKNDPKIWPTAINPLLGGHYSRDQSERMNLTGMNFEPFGVNGRKQIVNVRAICDWNEPLHCNIIPPSQICWSVWFSMTCFSGLALWSFFHKNLDVAFV